jgi:hypothetical protein
MLILKVESIETVQRKKKDGGTYQEQSAWVDLANGERRRVGLYVGRDGVVQPGVYTPSAESFGVNDFGRLQLNFLSLQPLQSAAEEILKRAQRPAAARSA